MFLSVFPKVELITWKKFKDVQKISASKAHETAKSFRDQIA